MKYRGALSGVVLLILCISMMICISSCSKQQEEVATEETPDLNKEVSSYGDSELGIDAKVDEELKDYRSILLLGIDNGRRSDLMVVLTINKDTNLIKSVAVHRDTYMQIAEDGTYTIDGVEREFYKCNRAYKRDGINGAMKELNRHMDLNIRECIAIDWEGMAKFIDLMGGFDAYIDENLFEYMNSNKPTDDTDADYTIDSVGEHHLTGWQAVQYLRARKYAGGSAPIREEHNQEAMHQIFDKAQKMSLEELLAVYNDILGDIETNMSNSVLTGLLASIAESTLEETPGWPYEYSTMWQDDNSYYYFVSDTLESNVIELHKTLFGQENYSPSETVKELNDKLETARNEQLH